MEAASPVTDVRRPRVIVVGVTPGRTAVRVAPAVVVALVPATGADVGAEDWLELPQAPHTRVAVARASLATPPLPTRLPFDTIRTQMARSRAVWSATPSRPDRRIVGSHLLASALLPRHTLALRADERQASMTQPFPVVQGNYSGVVAEL